MKKFFLAVIAAVLFTFSAAAEVAFDFGVGSGYVFYGSSSTKDAIKSINKDGQIIVCADAEFSFPLAESILLSAGADSILDGRWGGGNHIYLWDYAVFAGFDFYPGLGGLRCSVDYCLGRRTDFIDVNEEDDVNSTSFGNGFCFGAAYDFGWQGNGTAPVISASWRHMPRGGSSDNILELKLKLKFANN